MRAQVEEAFSLNGYRAAAAVKTPIVDIIIVNRNYGHFIDETIRSLQDQTYPHFDCWIVDNGSTDDSVAVVQEYVEADDRFHLMRLERNFGHVGAALKALPLSSNEFVVFVDADDVLFPNFLATHLQTHVGCRGVAISTSNLVEIDAAGRIMTGSMTFIADGWHGFQAGLSAAKLMPRIQAISDDDLERLTLATYYMPNTRTGWMWAPGTGNMYRRSVMDLFVLDDRDEPSLGGVDCSLNHVCHAVTGTMVIDMNLSARRVHGSNDHSRLPMLPNIYSGHPVADAAATLLRRRVLSTVMQRAAKLRVHLHPHVFFSIFDHVPNWDGRELRQFLDQCAPMIAEHFPTLVSVFGERVVMRHLGPRLSLGAMARILRLNKASSSLWFHLFRVKFRQSCKKILRAIRKMAGKSPLPVR